MSKIIEFQERKKIEQEAIDWIIRLDGDEELRTDERNALSEWVNRSHLHRQMISAVAKHWDKLNVLTELAVPLGRPRNASTVPITAVWKRRLRYVAYASIAVVALASTLLVWEGRESFNSANGFYATEIGKQSSHELPDGSVVLLNTNTQVKVDYGKSFRDIYLLKGEAHFTVAENDELPFRVFAGFGRIDAVGTEFSVYLRGDVVDVAVTEGSVALASIEVPSVSSGIQNVATESNREVEHPPTKNLGVLRAGQIGTIESHIDADLNRIDVLHNLRDLNQPDMSRRLAWTGGILRFSGEPLSDVVQEISRYTTVDIEFSSPEVGAIRVGGPFPVGETDIMFEVLETNFGLRITHLSEDRVLVSAGD